MNALEQLKQYTIVVADTGDIGAIEKYQPEDATTNPSLILKAASLPRYEFIIDEAVGYARKKAPDAPSRIAEACDRLAVSIGRELLNIVPGKVSTEVDARLSFDVEASVSKARKIIRMYDELRIPQDRILIKLASTWEGIRAAEILEREGIHCNLTLLFCFAQAVHVPKRGYPDFAFCGENS